MPASLRPGLPVVAAIVAVALTGGLPAPAAAGRPDAPTWSDEFAGSALDLTRWAHRASGARHQGIFTPEAVDVADGVLRLTTYTEDGKHYSGMISTQGSTGFAHAYGYFESRMRFSSASGQWSAFWLQSPTIGMPLDDPEEAGVEMDVVEHRVRCVTAPAPTPPQTCGPTSPIEDRAQMGLVWNGYGPESQSAIKLTDPLEGLTNGTWHTWALNWASDRLTFLFDDREIWSQTGPISQRSQYIILSSEVWELFAGPLPTGGYGLRATSSTDMQVDYVRAWSAPATAPQSTSPPTASGADAVGRALTCSAGTWSGVPAPAIEVQWLGDGDVLGGASGSTYTVQSDDRGHAVSCRVTATSVGGSVSAESNAIVIPPPPAPAPLLAQSVSPPPPPPPPPVLDRSAPRAALSGATSQRLGTSVAVTVACRDEPCSTTVTGTVRVPRVGTARARTFRPTARAVIGAGRRATIRLKLSSSARATIRRALRSRKRVRMALRVRVIDRAGNARTLNRTVVLKLPPRRSTRRSG